MRRLSPVPFLEIQMPVEIRLNLLKFQKLDSKFQFKNCFYELKSIARKRIF
jgi:hypothetical protein